MGSLAKYHRKRDFGKTPEPRGEVHPSRGALSYCIQKHAASRLHYDFRLELDGVLVSWAVPKGPSLDPAEKRLAVHVEDHPLEYGEFEGTIPRGEYGGGTVMLWDRGEWTPDGDPRAGYRRGRLKFRLDGEKLQGRWSLVRMGGGSGDDEKDNWLLLKDDDETARPSREVEITEEMPRSVSTGRSLDEIASASPPHEWRSNASRQAAVPAKKSSSSAKKSSASSRKPASKAATKAAAKLPETFLPELATLVDQVPQGDGWVHEVKLDGYRILARVEGGAARMVTRKGNDWTSQFPRLAKRIAEIAPVGTILDGELVVVAEDGTTSFQALQNVLGAGAEHRLSYWAFDLPFHGGEDLRRLPLSERKERLRDLLAATGDGDAVRYSDHIVAHGEEFYGQACRWGLEGIISKRADSAYVSRRSGDWVKVKCTLRQELVIGGYTAPRGSRVGLGALLVGYHRGGELVYAGKVGTGFNDALLRSLEKRLGKRKRADSPFAGKKREKDATWVEPELVCEVAFTGWTDDGRLRHPSFQGLREDKDPLEVVREDPASTPETETEAPAAEPKPKRAAAKPSPAPSTAARRPVRRGASADAEVAVIRLSNPDKVLFPDVGVTKLDLARYYERVAEQALAHVARRPLTLVRCPEGAGRPCFYQKHADDSFHESIRRVKLKEEEGRSGVYTYVQDLTGLVALVQMGVLELHTWGSHAATPEKPDRITLDLDPAPDVPWPHVVATAHELREELEALGLVSFAKTTGGKGLHVVVPLARRSDWEEVKGFSKAFVASFARERPGRYLIKSTLSARKGKIFLDYLRNGRGATAVTAYSVRARPGALVSVPVRWDELTPALKPTDFDLQRVMRRVKSLKRDPWEGYDTVRQSLTVKMRRAVGMT